MDAKTITAVTHLIEKIGFAEAILVVILIGMAGFCCFILKSNLKVNEQTRHELAEVKKDQAACHKEREQCRSELKKSKEVNSQLLETTNRAQLSLIASTEVHAKVTKTFVDALKGISGK